MPRETALDSIERNRLPALLNRPLRPHIQWVVSKVFASANNLEGGVYRFDYNAPAELYPGRNRKSAKKVSYRRFETAADAIRFAIEELPELLLIGACIEINDQRLNYKDIQALYASEQYPLKKRSLA
jgi:hypothetical protein